MSEEIIKILNILSEKIIIDELRSIYYNLNH